LENLQFEDRKEDIKTILRWASGKYILEKADETGQVPCPKASFGINVDKGACSTTMVLDVGIYICLCMYNLMPLNYYQINFRLTIVE
jgi:hypothetical protein